MKAFFSLLASLIVVGMVVGIFLPGWLLFPFAVGAGYGVRSLRGSNNKAITRGR